MADLEDREETQAAFTQVLHHIALEHRAEFLELVGDPPDITRVPSDFWVGVRNDLQGALVGAFVLVFMRSALQHGLLNGELIQLAATQLVQGRAAAVAQRYARVSFERLQGAFQDVSGISRTKIKTISQSVFGRGRARGIAVTETTRMNSWGGTLAIGLTSGLGAQDLWQCDVDPCEECEQYDGTPRAVWAADYPLGPPVHEHCQCWIDFDH